MCLWVWGKLPDCEVREEARAVAFPGYVPVGSRFVCRSSCEREGSLASCYMLPGRTTEQLS